MKTLLRTLCIIKPFICLLIPGIFLSLSLQSCSSMDSTLKKQAQVYLGDDFVLDHYAYSQVSSLPDMSQNELARAVIPLFPLPFLLFWKDDDSGYARFRSLSVPPYSFIVPFQKGKGVAPGEFNTVYRYLARDFLQEALQFSPRFLSSTNVQISMDIYWSGIESPQAITNFLLWIHDSHPDWHQISRYTEAHDMILYVYLRIESPVFFDSLEIWGEDIRSLYQNWWIGLSSHFILELTHRDRGQPYTFSLRGNDPFLQGDFDTYLRDGDHWGDHFHNLKYKNLPVRN